MKNKCSYKQKPIKEQYINELAKCLELSEENCQAKP